MTKAFLEDTEVQKKYGKTIAHLFSKENIEKTRKVDKELKEKYGSLRKNQKITPENLSEYINNIK